MNLLRVFFELFVLYMVYKLIFDFIIPIYNSTKQVKQKVNEMQRNMKEQVNQQHNQFSTAAKEAPAKEKKDDYIDFEELK
jgi:sortase (surface protein transpeptidase)